MKPKLRSRSQKRVRTVTPGGHKSLHIASKKHGRVACFECGTPLSGVPRVVVGRFSGLSKTKRRPERAFGGMLCPKCSRERIKASARRLEFAGAEKSGEPVAAADAEKTEKPKKAPKKAKEKKASE